MNGASISVVIPCFNARRFIGTAIRSVLGQRWPDLEIIVIDDGSTDGSAEYVAARFPMVTLLRQANQGAAAARNLGIRAARRSWIAFLDADDLWLPGKLRAQAALLAANPGVRLVYAAWQVWIGQTPSPSANEYATLLAGADEPERWRGPSGWIYPELLLDCAVWTSTVVMHRSLVEQLGAFDPTLRVGEDYDLWLRASRATRILRVDRPLALYRTHADSITRTHAPVENWRAVVVSRALARWGYGHERAAPASPADVQRVLARSWSEFALCNLQSGAIGRAGRGAWTALRLDPTNPVAWKVLAKTGFGAIARRPARAAAAEVVR